MATVILDSDYKTVEANLRRLVPEWDGGEFTVVGVRDGARWAHSTEFRCNARQFAEHVMAFGYDGYCLRIGNLTAGDFRREELLSDRAR